MADQRPTVIRVIVNGKKHTFDLLDERSVVEIRTTGVRVVDDAGTETRIEGSIREANVKD